jgi:hypothetical protein
MPARAGAASLCGQLDPETLFISVRTISGMVKAQRSLPMKINLFLFMIAARYDHLYCLVHEKKEGSDNVGIIGIYTKGSVERKRLCNV